MEVTKDINKVNHGLNKRKISLSYTPPLYRRVCRGSDEEEEKSKKKCLEGKKC